MTTKSEDELADRVTRSVSVELNPNRATKVLLGIVVGLGVLSLTSAYLHYIAGVPGIGRLVKGFLLDREANLPTLFIVAVLLACALLLGVKAIDTYASRAPWRYHWLILAPIFFFLAFDEAAQFHERFVPTLRVYFNTSGFLYFAWVIPGMAIVAVLVVAYFRFVLALPRVARPTVVAAAALYVSGAIGMEMIGGVYLDQYGKQAMESFAYHVVTGTEELLEMVGAVLFLRALMQVLGEADDGIRIHLKVR